MEQYDPFEITYLNVYPIIQELESNNIQSSKLYSSLGHLLNFSEPTLPKFEPQEREKYSLVKDGEISFRSGLFQGDSILTSSSVLIYLNSTLIEGKIDGVSFESNNVSQIFAIDTNQIIVQTDEVKIQDGIGFYSKTMTNSSIVNFMGDPAIILIENVNGTKRIITGTDIEIILDESEMFLRTPEILSNGIGKFSEFTTYGNTPEKLKFINKNIIVDGKTFFKIKFSDEFVIAKELSFQVNVLDSNEKYLYDELANIRNLFSVSFLPYLGIFSVIFVIINILIFRRTKRNLD